MKREFFLFFLLCLFLKLSAQDTIILPLKGKKWSSSQKNIIRFITPVDTGSTHFLDGIKNALYTKCFLLDLGAQNIGHSVSQKKILLYCSDSSTLSIVVDQNGNNNFADDSSYRIVLKNYESYKQYYDEAPLISIKDIQYTDSSGKIAKQDVCLKILPSHKNEKFIKNGYDFFTANKISLNICNAYYFSTVFKTDKVTYEIALIPHPFAYPQIALNDTKYDERTTYLNVYKFVEDEQVTLVSFDLLANHLKKQGVQSVLTIEGVVYKVLLASNEKLALTAATKSNLKNQGKTENSNFYSTSLLNTKTKKISSLSFSDTEFTLINFTGSWCLPCQTILPELKNIYSKYGGKLKVISIQKENNLSKAVEYVDKKKINWECFYENLNCTKDSCLQVLFKVSEYPTLILINKNEQIVYRASGDEGIKQVKSILMKLFLK